MSVLSNFSIKSSAGQAGSEESDHTSLLHPWLTVGLQYKEALARK